MLCYPDCDVVATGKASSSLLSEVVVVVVVVVVAVVVVVVVVLSYPRAGICRLAGKWRAFCTLKVAPSIAVSGCLPPTAREHHFFFGKFSSLVSKKFDYRSNLSSSPPLLLLLLFILYSICRSEAIVCSRSEAIRAVRDWPLALSGTGEWVDEWVRVEVVIKLFILIREDGSFPQWTARSAAHYLPLTNHEDILAMMIMIACGGQRWRWWWWYWWPWRLWLADAWNYKAHYKSITASRGDNDDHHEDDDDDDYDDNNDYDDETMMTRIMMITTIVMTKRWW